MRAINYLTVILCSAVLANPVLAGDKGDDNLPPGLQKKVARGEPLPPGWQKKLKVGEPLSREVYSHREVVVPIDDEGLVTVRIEGKLIRLIDATREVVELL